MQTSTSTGLFRRRQFLCGCCATLVGARAVPALAALGDDPASAPLARDEPRHHVVFQNDLVRVLRVLIPPGDSTLWHEHNFDIFVLALYGSKIRVEVAKDPNATEGRMESKSLRFVKYAGQHFVHRVANTDTVVNHQVDFEIIPPSPSGFSVSDRSAAPHYKMEIDNDRIRAWRIGLEPGEIASTIVQKAPGLRFVLSGDRVLETNAQGQVNEIGVRPGDFAWLPGGASRSLSNAGAASLELIEVELK
jgi:quercetin dioxygenase-like cupin family protein